MYSNVRQFIARAAMPLIAFAFLGSAAVAAPAVASADPCNAIRQPNYPVTCGDFGDHGYGNGYGNGFGRPVGLRNPVPQAFWDQRIPKGWNFMPSYVVQPAGYGLVWVTNNYGSRVQVPCPPFGLGSGQLPAFDAYGTFQYWI